MWCWRRWGSRPTAPSSSWPRPATHFRSRPPIWPRRRRVHCWWHLTRISRPMSTSSSAPPVMTMLLSWSTRSSVPPTTNGSASPLMLSVRFSAATIHPVMCSSLRARWRCWPNGPVGLRAAFWRSISMALSSATTPRPRVSWRRSPPCSRLMCSCPTTARACSMSWSTIPTSTPLACRRSCVPVCGRASRSWPMRWCSSGGIGPNGSTASSTSTAMPVS